MAPTKRTVARTAAVVLPLLLAGCAASLRWLSYRDPAPAAVMVADIPVYGDALRALPLYEDVPEQGAERPPRYAGPGWDVKWSPDRRFAAVTTDWDDNYHLMPPPRRGTESRATLELISDATCFHTVAVWDQGHSALRPIVTTREADCLSGRSHKYDWSADSRALLVYGIESEPDRRLCVVHLVRSGQTFRLGRCPKDG
jgi:hypothetical protein